MDFKEYLLSVGLNDEQANKVVEGMPANKLYLATEENLDTRYTKLKEQKEQLENDLNAATKLVGNLKKTNKDAEELQNKITEYEQQVQQLETERVTERKAYALKEALTKEGASDIEYMLYKLGEVEVDKDGNIVDLENKVKALKETNPTFFASETKNNEPGAPGYQVVDNKLDNGQASDPVATASAEFEKSLGLATE